MKKVSLITVNFNHSYLTEELLRSIFRTQDLEGLEIIVVDNGSDTNPVSAWELKYPEVIFLRSETNLGFAGGNNLGIKKATGELVFLLNNDTELSPDLISQLAEFLTRNKKAGIVSPRINYFENQRIIQYAGFTPINWKTGRNRCLGQFEQDRGQYDQAPYQTSFAHGAAMMFRKELIREAGYLPEQFFLYYEEMDWCETVKRLGYQIWVAPSLVIYHKESISVGANSPLKEYFMTRNRILFMRRNADSGSFLIFTLYFAFVVAPRNILNYLAKGRKDLLGAFIKAIAWHFKSANSQAWS